MQEILTYSYRKYSLIIQKCLPTLMKHDVYMHNFYPHRLLDISSINNGNSTKIYNDFYLIVYLHVLSGVCGMWMTT